MHKYLAILLSMAFATQAGCSESQNTERLQPNKKVIAKATDFVEITWQDLIPKGWDPAAEFRGLDMSRMKDSDPRAIEAMEKMRRVWDEAPVEFALNGKRIRMPGYALPLERKGEEVLEFLLVPYFGACIHTPPPPANQLVHVVLKNPIKGMSSMDMVWVSGKLEAHRADSGFGVAGYRLQGELVTAYGKPRVAP